MYLLVANSTKTKMTKKALIIVIAICFNGIYFLNAQKKYSKKQIEKLKSELTTTIEDNKKQAQVMVDKIFSFAELGFQEIESSKYLKSLRKEL